MIGLPVFVIRDARLTAAAAATVATTTSIASRYLLDLLEAAGQPADALLAQAGVARASLATPDVAMPLPVFAELWRRAAALQPDIGVTLVDRFPDGQMHMLAHLAMRSPTVRRALEDVCRYAGITSTADAMMLSEHGDVAVFGYTCLDRATPLPWLAEHYLSMATRFLSLSTGRALPVRAVRLAGPAGAPVEAYVRRFGVTPDFGAGENALEFDATALDWPLLTHDDYLHALLAGIAQARTTASLALAATIEPAASAARGAMHDLIDRVRAEIATRIVRGGVPGIGDVAAACRLGARGLRERLAREGTTFRQLLDEVRRDLAREHLARGLSVTETAYLLGFSEPAALQHACLRWFGQAAGEVRRALLDARAAD